MGGMIFLVGLVGGIIVYAFIQNTPPIASIERWDYFQESTVIYDKNKNPIYTLYNDGKRTYVPYADIANPIKDALISTEDKTFFENPGIDFKGLVRAGMNYALGKTDRIKGTSTLSQQLISYTLLSKERSIKRKIKEAYLSYELNNNYPKEKILEMYLNTISFWHNANGVEEASKTFFGKSSKDVGPLWASILASLPKWPTYYSPYLHRDRLMGYVHVYPIDDPSSAITLDNTESRTRYSRMYNIFKGYLSGITLESHDNEIELCGIKEEYMRGSAYAPDAKGCIYTEHDALLSFFGDIVIREDIVDSGSTTKYALEYTVWRKDFVAWRMFEDGKMDGNTFKKVIYDGLEFEFKKYTENIRYPHFVMYIKEYLESHYGNDIDITQWLKVYTTLDPNLQNKAEELVQKQTTINRTQYWAKSAALVSMDNKNGALLAMVGGPDYFDRENGGNNNMALARRQPGSSFKPLVYALAISKRPIGPASPIADVKTSFGSYEPNNYDNKFKGVMSVEKALAYSRNIPAIKMYFLAGKEEDLTPFGQSLGLTTLEKNAAYGAPMAIGTAEVRPIDLMQAYSVLANLWVKREVHAIEKIVDSDGNTIEEYKKPEKETPIFSPAASYITTAILSNIEARPEGMWRTNITVSGNRRVAVKTGTSNKEMWDDKILPRDLWTAGYSPEITTVVWAGNVDGKETKWNCDGLNCAAPIWKGFMEYAHKNITKSDWKEPEGIYKYTIVKSSGRLATATTPADQKISTIMAVKLWESDQWYRSLQIDSLCGGPVSENTPEWAIETIYIPIADPIIDGYDKAWKNAFMKTVSRSGVWSAPCDRPTGVGNISIGLSIVGVWAGADTNRKTVEWSWSWDRAIKEWSFTYDGEPKMRQTIEDKTTGNGRINVAIDAGDHTVTFEVIDIYGYRYRESRTIRWGTISEKSSNNSSPSTTGAIQSPINLTPTPSTTPPSVTDIAPTIALINPRSWHINLYQKDTFNLRFRVDTDPGAREVSVSVWGRSIYTATSGETFVVPVSADGLWLGSQTITISVVDSSFRSATRSVQLTVLTR
jgi:penicillin-binding protein 1A